MYKSCLVVASTEMRKRCFAALFAYAKDYVSQRIFITFRNPPYNLDYWHQAVAMCYATASEVCPSLDCNLIIPSIGKREKSLSFDMVLAQPEWIDQSIAYEEVLQLDETFQGDVVFAPKTVEVARNNDQSATPSRQPTKPVYSAFPDVCLGGTFDGLHNGHKVLLTTAALLASNRLLVGVTGSSILAHKTLAPLIAPLQSRCQKVRDFLTDVGAPVCRLELVELDDAYGPPAHDPNFSCIVCSAESVPSCEKLNEIRQNKGWSPLAIEKIDFVQGDTRKGIPDDLDDGKTSSSALRYTLLGSLLRPIRSTGSLGYRSTYPYIIGLAGPSGSGKTSVARRLAALDNSVHVVDCDQLGHRAYEPGTECHKRLLDHFGMEQIAELAPPHRIDRSRLGRLVFSDESRLMELNRIVWPEIRRQILDVFDQLEQAGNCTGCMRSIAVLDAAVLFQAQWDEMCNEVWLTIIPRDEAVRRICERNQLPLATAQERLERQSTAIAMATGGRDFWAPGQLTGCEGPVARAHVVLCTQWSGEHTQAQVEKAYAGLVERLQEDSD